MRLFRFRSNFQFSIESGGVIIKRDRKVCVIGHFGYGKNLSNGQTIKTKILTDELIYCFGRNNVAAIDTHGGIKIGYRLPIQILHALATSENVIMLPAKNGVKFISLLLLLENLFFKRALHYVVIGGWLNTFLDEHRWLIGVLKKFTGIYVETASMKNALIEKQLFNTLIMHNFKKLQILQPEELVYAKKKPYRLCTFSRVIREKGIEDAIYAVKAVNEDKGYIAFTLDIYGVIGEGYEDRFEEIQKTLPSYIRYGGVVEYNKSVEVLKFYYALLFPTYYSGEGFAGSLLDALAAGLPVVSSDWHYNDEIVIDGQTGLLYPTKDIDALQQKLKWILENQQEWNAMKLACIKKSETYKPEVAIQCLIDKLD